MARWALRERETDVDAGHGRAEVLADVFKYIAVLFYSLQVISLFCVCDCQKTTLFRADNRCLKKTGRWLELSS